MAESIEQPDKTFPFECSSSSGTSHGYTVEARYDYHGQSTIINGLAIGPNWHRISFDVSPLGTGVPKGLIIGADAFSPLLTYACAQAMRWWFVAVAALEHKDICLKTRLVRHSLKYEHKDVEVGVVDEIDRHLAFP